MNNLYKCIMVLEVGVNHANIFELGFKIVKLSQFACNKGKQNMPKWLFKSAFRI
jgi:hypothetical protein